MKAIYAGSFDPFTLGHLEILKKAQALFEEVIMLVGHDPNKKYLFSDYERARLVEESTGARTIILPEDEVTALQARDLGVTHLVRGLRGHTDIDNEFVAARMNREVGDGLETVFFVPDVNVEELSSTVVRGLHGLRGWVDMVSTRVPPPVLRALKLADLKKRVDNDMIWSLVLSVEEKPYHNLEHSFDVAYDLIYDVAPVKRQSIAVAAAVHDLKATPAESIGVFGGMVRLAQKTQDMVMATDHAQPYSEDDLCRRFASADLKVLARDRYSYVEYVKKLRSEYDVPEDEWNMGRRQFLEDMLGRDPLFPHPEYEGRYREFARNNMGQELRELKKNDHSE